MQYRMKALRVIVTPFFVSAIRLQSRSPFQSPCAANAVPLHLRGRIGMSNEYQITFPLTFVAMWLPVMTKQSLVIA
jgi:hypothetical protein